MMSRLAWLLWAVTIVVVIAAAGRMASGDSPADAVLPIIFVVVIGTVGAVVSARVPKNPIGWLFFGLALFWAFTWLAEEALAATGRAALAQFGVWLGHWAWVPVVLVPVTFVLMLFPDGRLPSPRWRPVAWAAAVGVPGLVFEMAFGPYLGGSLEYGPNPYHLEGVVGIGVVWWSAVPLVPAVIGSLASVTMRFRRAGGVERQQIKWLAYGSATAVVALAMVGLATEAGVITVDAGSAITLLAIMLIPVSVGVAILRYRLYDIDRLVSRTVSYALLSGVLVSVYVAGVLLLSRVLAPVGAGSDLAVAVATLAAAAVFQPARRRIQAAVDRRFNRGRYDAARTIDGFSARLRNEFDLDAVGVALVDVVFKTMEPAGVSLWLRDAAGRR